MRLSFLRPLYRHRTGPWASVYLDASRDRQDAARAIGLRWRGLREDLAEHGADQPTLTALDDALDRSPRIVGRGGLAMFAAGGQVPLVAELPEPPVRDRADWSPRPRVRELVAARAPSVRWVRATVDRTGAELSGADSVGDSLADSTVDVGWLTVTGPWRHPITKVAPGGWSQARYQRAAENSWYHNAAEVARVLTEATDRVDADIVVLAGDVRARQMLLERLPERLVERVVQIEDGNRADGGYEDALRESTERVVRERAERRTQDTLDRFRTDLAHGNAVRGLGPVTEAARQRRLSVLVLAEDTAPGTVWIDVDRPESVATAPDLLRDLGVAAPAEEDSDTALLAAATVGDGEAIIVPIPHHDLPDGVGAILR